MTVNVGVALDPSFGMWNSRYVFNHFDIPHRLQQMLQGASYSYWIRYTWETIVVCYNLPSYFSLTCSIKMDEDAPQEGKMYILSRYFNGNTIVSWESAHGHLNITCDFGPHGHLPGI